MLTRQINKLVMYLSMRNFCSDPKFANAIAKLPVFAEHTTEFLDTANVIRLRRQAVLDLNPAGLTVNKEALREQLAEQTASLSACVVAFAKNRSDEHLAQKAHLTKTTISSGRNVDAADRVENLLALTQELLPQLGGYGVTAERLEQINALNQSFSDLVGRPRAVIGERKRVNASLPDLFEDADFHLEQMDRLSSTLEQTHPDFVSGFRVHRKVHHVAASRSLSREEQANAEARDARRALKQAMEEARIADLRATAEADRAKARALASKITPMRESAKPSPVPDQDVLSA